MKNNPTQRGYPTAKLKTKAVVKKRTKKISPNNKNKGGLAEDLFDAMAGIAKSFSLQKNSIPVVLSSSSADGSVTHI